MLIEYEVCKVRTTSTAPDLMGKCLCWTGHNNWQWSFISSCQRRNLLPNPAAKPCSSLHRKNWQTRFPLISEPTESGSNITSVCYTRGFISFQLIKLFCWSPAWTSLSWSRTCCSFSSFAIGPLSTPTKTGESRQIAWNLVNLLYQTQRTRRGLE